MQRHRESTNTMRNWLTLFVVVCAILTAIPASAATCDSLSSLKLENIQISSARIVSAGSFSLPPESASLQLDAPYAFNALPSFCRVQGVIQPSHDSDIKFEVWLPVAGWNGKYQGIGNGGFAGSILYNRLADALAHNYATAATDTGHQGNAIDASWALGHPEKSVDFGYRAIHETVVAAKEIIQAFYGSKPEYSYFNSCSNGGRQALMEAQRFPEDYDGIIAGAPAHYWTHLLSVAVASTLAVSNDKSSFLNPAKLPAVQEAVLADCDMLDKVKDGVLENPSQCKPDLSKLLCSGKETDRCLTESQLAALKKLYAGPHNAEGEQLSPGFPPGDEANPQGWSVWITGKEPTQGLLFDFGTQFYKNMVYNDPSWDFRTFDWDRDTRAADEKMAPILNATDPDLTQFKKRGGKLILYHGWNDAGIPAQFTVDYYKSVVSKMGQKETDEFVRLFMVPGMQHCAGGIGCDNFGQQGVARGNPESNISAALERWVEEGMAPDTIIAAKYKAGDSSETRTVRTHPLCPYPKVAQYKGSGSTDEAANFVCVESK